MRRLLIVHHSPTAATRGLTDAVVAGANDREIEGVTVVVRPALEVSRDQALSADAYLLGTSANFGYMSGALKHFFDCHFLELGGALDDTGATRERSGGKRPYGLWVHGRYDTSGAARSVQAITGALPWAQAAPLLELTGEIGPSQTDAAYELGATVATVLAG